MIMKVIDLTMRVSPETKVFPGSPQPAFIAWTKFDVHSYDSEVLHMSSHTGTHMDAPCHFAPGMQAIDDISPSRLVSQAVLVRIPKKANQLIEEGDISEDIREGETVVFSTGWEKQYKSSHYMTRNPGLSGKAASYLVKKKVNAVAIDGPSIDVGFDEKFTAHNVLLPAGVPAVENLCNLDRIGRRREKGNSEEGTRFTLIVAPLKLVGASGSPVRALALLF
jgi:kynurenine formamidase